MTLDSSRLVKTYKAPCLWCGCVHLSHDFSFFLSTSLLCLRAHSLKLLKIGCGRRGGGGGREHVSGVWWCRGIRVCARLRGRPSACSASLGCLFQFLLASVLVHPWARSLESKDLVLQLADGAGLGESQALGRLLEPTDHGGRAAEQDLDVIGGLGEPFLEGRVRSAGKI